MSETKRCGGAWKNIDVLGFEAGRCSWLAVFNLLPGIVAEFGYGADVRPKSRETVRDEGEALIRYQIEYDAYLIVVSNKVDWGTAASFR